MTAQRQLLLGVLAYQNGLLTREQLTIGLAAWERDQSRDIEGHLIEQGGNRTLRNFTPRERPRSSL
jgi:hypothetical protein